MEKNMENEFKLDLNLRPTNPKDLLQIILLGKEKQIRLAAFKEFLKNIHSSIVDLLTIHKETKDDEIRNLCEEKIKNDAKIIYFLDLIDTKKRFYD